MRLVSWLQRAEGLGNVGRLSGAGDFPVPVLPLERHSAQRAGLLTERTRRELQRARQRRRHVQASEPGELVCLDTFCIGRLKGVGKVWQITACDAACSRLHASSRTTPLSTPWVSSWRSSCLSTKRLIGRFSES